MVKAEPIVCAACGKQTTTTSVHLCVPQERIEVSKELEALHRVASLIERLDVAARRRTIRYLIQLFLE